MKWKIIAPLALLGLLLATAILWLRPAKPDRHLDRIASESPAQPAGDDLPARSLAPSEGERAPAGRLRDSTKPVSPAPRVIDPASIPDSVRPIYGLGGESIFQRLDAVKALARKLRPEEITALFAFASARPAPGADRGPLDSDAALKNDVLNALRFQPHSPAGLTGLLIGIYRDREQDIVMRDYAVQHLVSLYEQLPGSRIAEKKQIQQVLQAALAETDSSIAGTALLGMHNLSTGHPEFDTPELTEAALNLARDDTARELVRITALQVCAGRGIKDALPAALALANAAPTIPVQISAIAALGTLGTAEHRALLEELAESPEARLRPAAQTALNRLQARLAQARARPN
jgi:hypothetical protein